jgi:hypothetical protein
MPEINRHNAFSSASKHYEGENRSVTPSSSAIERREAERDLVSYLGIASYGDGETFQVELTDLSALGARLISREKFDPPAEFVLKIPETGACFLSELLWNDGTACGVRFLKPLP